MKKILTAILPVIFIVTGFKAGAQQANKPFVIGEIAEDQIQIAKENRTLNIYLPEGYDPKDTIKYPVIYLLDGSADEDFIHICGIVQFCNFSWVNLLPKSIVVGISNVDRKRDFTYPTTIEKDKKEFPTTGGSEKFIAFIEKELQPYIDKNYRTTAFKTIIGQSLGGLLATEILLKKPQLFNRYFIISPSVWWDNGSILKLLPGIPNKQSISVYIAVGKEGREMEEGAGKLANLMKTYHVNTFFKFFGDKDHANIMHEAIYDGIQQLSTK